MVAVLICHHWWPILSPFSELLKGTRIATYIDLITPVAVVGTAAWAMLAGGQPGTRRWMLFVFAAIVYVEGHGIHLAANSINNKDPLGAAAETAQFWDEEFSHLLWYSGWAMLAAVLVWSGGNAPRLTPLRAVLAFLYGLTACTNSIEGGAVPMMFAISVAFIAATWRAPTGLRQDALVAFGSTTLLLIIFGIWQGGYPQFSELGWL